MAEVLVPEWARVMERLFKPTQAKEKMKRGKNNTFPFYFRKFMTYPTACFRHLTLKRGDDRNSFNFWRELVLTQAYVRICFRAPFDFIMFASIIC